MEDVYYTIEKEGTAVFREKMSRFLSFAHYVRSAEEAKEYVKLYQNEYHDSRHVCWAYMIGPDRKEWQLNDNGEPSGTAGKPILGQINSRELTDVVVIVVRYFGGIKLGTPGRIAAYREAGAFALDDAGKREMHEMERVAITFPYVAADGVMKLIKGLGVTMLDRSFDNVCTVTVEYRKSLHDEFLGRLSKIEGAAGELL